MTDLEKYNKVNQTESLQELAEVIRGFAPNGNIQGRARKFSSELMAIACENYSLFYHNTLTREFGIRQQAIMLLHHNQK